MKPRDLPEWDGERLQYVEPTQVVRSYGYDIFTSPHGPETLAWNDRTLECVTAVDGEVAPVRRGFDSPADASVAVKARAGELGASRCGITALDQAQVYEGMEVPHANVILVALPMDYEEMHHGATERHVREVLKIYAEVGGLACDLAATIREWGYPATAHTLRFEQVNMIPLAIAAGLGELGKHGSLINRELGCSFRLAAVTTDLPMGFDEAVDEGIDAICASCQMCTRWCPGDAIYPDKQPIRGEMRWLVDTEKCAPYWGSFYSCGICLQVCPFNAKAHDALWKRTFVEMTRREAPEAMKARLDEGLQTPWQYVEPPETRTGDWRNEVRGRGESAILIQGIPVTGLPDAVYEQRAKMGADPRGD